MTVRRVIHIADIHIGSRPDRSTEYRAVFDSLGALLQPNDVVAICGDVFHNKTTYSAADVADFRYLLDTLRNVDTIIIPGNHDMSMNNPALTLIDPLVRTDWYPLLVYATIEGRYVCGGIAFYHIPVEQRGGPGHLGHTDCVLLYHGFLEGNSIRGNRGLPRETYSKYRACLAGDIHQHHFLSPTAAYSGSLIQQNHGEGPIHGCIIWTFEGILPPRGVFHPLYGAKMHIDYDFTGGDWQAPLMPCPLYSGRLITTGTKAERAEQIARVEAAGGRVDCIKYVPPPATIVAGVVEEAFEVCLAKHNLDPDDSAYVRGLLHTGGHVHRKWSILSAEWHNMFKYGPGNYLDFTKVGGLTGIIAGNMAGKTSLIDILCFALFNTAPRGAKSDQLHVGAKECSVKVRFESNGVEYSIRRAHDGAQRVEHYFESGGVNLCGATLSETYARISALIGTWEEFQMTALLYRSTATIRDLIYLDGKSRRLLLGNLFGLAGDALRIAECKKQVTKLKKSLPAKLTRDRPSPPSMSVDSLTAEIDALAIANEQWLAAAVELRSYNGLLVVPYTDVPQEVARPGGVCPGDFDILSADISDVSCKSQLNMSDTELGNYIQQWRDPTECQLAADSIILESPVDLPPKPVLGVRPTAVTAPSPRPVARSPADVEADLGRAHIACPDLVYSPGCPSCDCNHAAVTELQQQLGASRAELLAERDRAYMYADYLARKTKWLQYEADIASWRVAAQQYECLMAEYNACIAKNESIRSKAAAEAVRRHELQQAAKRFGEHTLEEAKAEYARRKNLALHTKRELAQGWYKYLQWASYRRDVLGSVQDRRTEHSEALIKLGCAKQQLADYETGCRANDEYLAKWAAVEREIRLLKVFEACLMDPDYNNYVITRSLADVCDYANDILAKIAGFTVATCLEGEAIKFSLCVSENGKQISMELASGFQQFICAIVFRLALTNTMFSSADFMIIDEGFGAVDSGNLTKCIDLLMSIKDSYKFMMIISHIDTLHVSMDCEIGISSTGSASRLVYPSDYTVEGAGCVTEVSSTSGVSSGLDGTVACPCGARVKPKSMAAHKKTKRHTTWVATAGDC